MTLIHISVQQFVTVFDLDIIEPKFDSSHLEPGNRLDRNIEESCIDSFVFPLL